MKIACDACQREHEFAVSGPTLLRRALPKGWRPRRIDGRVYILCEICGNVRQFVGGLSPYLSQALRLPTNATIELPELTELPDSWLDHIRGGSLTERAQRAGRPRKPGDAMTDINKIITSRQSGEDPERAERAASLAGWDMAAAAAKEGIALTDAHREVVRWLQKQFLDHGPSSRARELADLLAQQFAGTGGRKHLYELFPGGPVSQGGRVAGIPVPADARDPSFGSAL